MNNHKNEGTTGAEVVVFLSLSDGARKEALTKTLTAASDGHAMAVVDSLSALERAIQNVPNAHIVIIYAPPDIDIGLALKAGAQSRKALDNWKMRASALLDVVRRNRRRVVLIDDDTLVSDPVSAKTALGFRFTPLEQDEQVGQPSPLIRLISQTLLQRDTAASALADELIASSQYGDDATISLNAAQEELDTLQSTADRAKKHLEEAEQYKALLNDRQAEHDSVLAEMFRLQETLQSTQADLERKIAQTVQLGQGLESSEAQVKQLSAARDELLRRVSEAEVTLAEQQARHDEEKRKQASALEESLSALNERSLALEALEAEAEKLRRAMRDKGGEVELLTRRLADTESTLRAREDDLNARDAEIAAFYASKSYRMTAPLRWLSAALRGRS